MQQSNTYIIVFSAILTIVIGGLMSLTSVVLKPAQDKQVELDTKKKILGAVMDISEIEDPNEILAIYDQRISSTVVDIEGNEITQDDKGNALVAEKVNIQKNYKRSQEERFYPIFMFKNESGIVDAYIFPMFGAGLWDWISGYLAVDKDLNTIRGIAFDHKQETPGLGARITDEVVQNRYKGKKIFENGSLKSVTMVKGEGHSGLTDYQVDGMSGATMTAKGVNKMLEHYLACYTAYIDKVKSNNKLALN
ncbi:MAG: NADH:ubiquinone reductase (Na(+)-transporting) subunit C [Cyclobacteriaceae bacterium]|nr:NADH:ubiquinone reductase (Na(+)-transporting) subunit C [Cyclobacteriaceae bacterium HetDA_MAG_MS6]